MSGLKPTLPAKLMDMLKLTARGSPVHQFARYIKRCNCPAALYPCQGRCLVALNSTVNKNTMSLHKTKTLLVMSVAALLAGAPALSFAAPQANWSGNVTHVEDGDSIKVRPVKGSKPVSIRIDGIDAPEICQTGGKLSRDRLQQRLLGKRVEVQSQLKDGRRTRVKSVQAKVKDIQGPQVARVLLARQDQGKWMVSQGLAWSYRYRTIASPYAVQEKQAQAAGRGLFARTNAKPPLYPRTFRKQHGSCSA